jgi:acid stress-induced BolA-like protein IbaG/YrbA
MNSELITTITGKISTALETDRVNVVDVNGDGRHISVSVVSNNFEGKNSVQRQRLVYKVRNLNFPLHFTRCVPEPHACRLYGWSCRRPCMPLTP